MTEVIEKKSFSTKEKKSKTLIPYAMLCELTHRCPLSCPYCSNPVQLELKSNEIGTDLWKKALTDAVKIGILQAHFSGGEPTARKDLEDLISHAAKIGLYTNLITSGVLINEDRLKKLYDAGLDHVQVSIQDTDPDSPSKIITCDSNRQQSRFCNVCGKCYGVDKTCCDPAFPRGKTSSGKTSFSCG